MTYNSPSSRLSPPMSTAASAPSPRAGNLARLKPDQPGHFLSQPFEQFFAHGTYLNKVETASPRPSLWRAGRENRRSPCAESGTSFPFVDVDHFSHRGGSFSSQSRKRELKRSSFHDAGKTFHDRAC